MTDQKFDECVILIQKGNQDGLREIYEAYHGLIYAVVYEVLLSRESAEDVAADFFIKLWKIADGYHMGGKHKAWIITIARNMAIDSLRKLKKEQPFEVLPKDQQRMEDSSEELLLDRLTLEQALQTLEKEEREIVNLKIMGEMTLRQISRIIQKPLGTVAWKYRNAMSKLKRCSYD